MHTGRSLGHVAQGLEIKEWIIVNKLWFKAAGIRALKTVAQTAIATIGTAMLLSDVNWLAVVSASTLSGVLSILTSVAGLPEVKGGPKS